MLFRSAYFGKLILDGKIPYKDFYEVKFPGLFYSYAFMIKLFGYDLKSLHFGFTIINLINTILIFFISLKFFRPAISLFTSIMFSIYSLNPDMSGFTIQAEHLVSFFISLGIYFILSNEVKNSNFKIFLSGIFLSFAVMIKTAAFSIILFVTIYFIFNLFYKKNKLKRSKILFNILYFSLGCAFTVISFLFLIILKGSLSEMIYFTFKMSSRYITQINFSQGFLLLKGEIIRIIDNHKLFWFISILGFCVLFIQKIQIGRAHV